MLGTKGWALRVGGGGQGMIEMKEFGLGGGGGYCYMFIADSDLWKVQCIQSGYTFLLVSQVKQLE